MKKLKCKKCKVELREICQTGEYIITKRIRTEDGNWWKPTEARWEMVYQCPECKDVIVQ
jgi:hypothetical protein